MTEIFIDGENPHKSKIKNNINSEYVIGNFDKEIILTSALRIKANPSQRGYEAAIVTPITGLNMKNINANIHPDDGSASSSNNRVNIFVPENGFGIPNWSNTFIEYTNGTPIKNVKSFEIFVYADDNSCIAEIYLDSKFS